MQCIACKTISNDVAVCPICKPYAFCTSCNQEEMHNGAFTCFECKKVKCNTYLEVDTLTNNNVCWECFARARQSILMEAFQEFKTNNPKNILSDTLEKMVESTGDAVNKISKHIK